MASWSTFTTPDYNTRLVFRENHRDEAVASPPSNRLAIPKTTAFQAPRNGLPINPSPHPSTDPAIQAPIGGRSSPALFDYHRSPVLEQREYLSPQDIAPQRFVDFTQGQDKPTEASSLSRSSSQASFDTCQHCQCCSRRKGHARSNSYSSIASSRTSSSVNLSSASPDMNSPFATPPAEQQKRSSAFGRTFKFLQRSSSLEVHGTRDDSTQRARKRATSIAGKKKVPVKKVVFEMVTEDDHWADE